MSALALIAPRDAALEPDEAHRLRGDFNLLLLSLETLETQLRLEGNAEMAARVRAALDRGLRKQVHT